jgi:hypothetical protein
MTQSKKRIARTFIKTRAGEDVEHSPSLVDCRCRAALHQCPRRTERPAITPEEMQRRRRHVEVAIADNRLAGFDTNDDARAVCDAYIRGEIEAGELVTAYQEGRYMTDEAAMAAPETLSFCDRCKDCDDERLWRAAEKDAACPDKNCPNKPVEYIRADLFNAQVKRMEENALEYIDETGLRIATLNHLLRKARDRLDAFGDADLMDEINSALGKGIA